ncbi:hypothetical protein AZE42_11726 [Rhizopogon vesiculosus]|uniref:Uncharacterized protein n=1 Tax=Rhizopogon vesiculosus TaxID=180088 RepID=A0A1J8Q4I4_9AGAM|nr:hypothetical protein AZE42_11726 [Rhizopogon vesiculosus]
MLIVRLDSGHGGHEATIYPVDYKRAGMIIDDEMHHILVKSLPVGCRLTAVFGSRYSSQRAILGSSSSSDTMSKAA